MKTIIAGVVLLCIGVACAGRTFPYRSLVARAASADGNQPYWILGAPRKGGNSIQAVQVPLSASDLADDDDDDDDQENNNFEQEGIFSVVQDDDEDDDSSNDDHTKEQSFENDDDDEEDSELTGNVIRIISLGSGNRIFSNPKDALEDREIVNDDDVDDDDEESGETAIFLPRAALENLPNGSILTLVDDYDSTGRAIRRVVRRKRGGRPKRRRRGNNQSRRRRRRRGGNRRRPNIRVIRPRRGGNGAANRRRGPNVIRL